MRLGLHDNNGRSSPTWTRSCTSNGSKGSGAPLVTRSIRNGASVYPPGEGAT